MHDFCNETFPRFIPPTSSPLSKQKKKKKTKNRNAISLKYEYITEFNIHTNKCKSKKLNLSRYFGSDSSVVYIISTYSANKLWKCRSGCIVSCTWTWTHSK
jgi:hypothetical protein